VTLNVGLIYLGSLRVHRFGSLDRYYVVVPPVPVAQSIAGKRLNFTAEVSCSNCNDKSLEGLLVTFKATVSAIKRSDGDYWYRITLPTRYRDVWRKVADRGQIKLYLSLI
jgi:hypothetical protein